MSSSSNNDTFETLFGRGDDREQSGYYTSTSRQQNAPVIGNSSRSELHWTGGPHRESCLPTSLAPNTSSWPSTTFPDPSSSVYRGGVWPGDLRHGEPRLGSLLGTPGSSANRSGVSPVGVRVATPVLEQCFPAVSRALPAFQCFPPSSNWPQVPGAHWQPTSTWGHPVRTARQHNDQGNSISPPAIRPGIPPFQSTTSSVIVEASERRFMPTGRPLPSVATPNFVQPPTFSDAVPASSSRSRGERWDLPNETMFHCLWTSRCAALIAGNGRSLRNHLRDEHDFTYDDQGIVCTWGECSTYVQRRNVPRHIVACHFAVKVTCPQCGLALSRADAKKKHGLACTGASKASAVVEAME